LSSYRVSIDVGGTFTDVTCMREDTGTFWVSKVLTTYTKGIATGVADALKRIIEISQTDPATIKFVIHATTQHTNTILQRNGAKTGLLTTEGHEDVLEIGRMKRPDAYDITIETWRPTFIAPRAYRMGIPERVNAEGKVIRPLDMVAVEKAVDSLVSRGVKSIAICYLFSFLYPKHEEDTHNLITSKYPSIYVTRSSELLPEFREYERTCLTVTNAYLGPVVGEYLERLERAFVELGVKAELNVMQSSGGITKVSLAKKMPVRAIESGPAAGVIASSFIGSMAGFSNLISFDMGGTTAKAGLVLNGKPRVVNQYELFGLKGRFVAGAFYPIKVAAIDVAEVGTGGGSIAWVDEGGMLRVGPKSAGSDPGPACYSFGGTEPTVTDANLILGYINPEAIASGQVKINYDNAETALTEKVAKPLGREVVEAARGITRIADAQMARGVAKITNTQMAQAIKLVSVDRGFDPREFPIMALGGGGPVHALSLAEELDISTVIVPDNPGVATTLGLLSVDFTADVSLTHKEPLDTAVSSVFDRFRELDSKLASFIKSEGMLVEDLVIERSIDMKYAGQGYEINVPIPSQELTKEIMHSLEQRFHEAHRRLYGYSLKEQPIEIVTYRELGRVVTPKPRLRKFTKTSRSPARALKTERAAYFDKYRDYVKAPVYDSNMLRSGNKIEGPAIVEYENSTLVVQPDYVGAMDEYRNIVLKKRRR
jgi:N-methylhydantoinase A